MSHIIYIALGTNLGERFANLHAAIASLPPAVEIQARSHVYETPPWGFADQPAFLNMVIKGKTDLQPLNLLGRVKRLESDLGRVPTFRNGPRKIDLDLLLYDDLVMDLPMLSLPHPHLHERPFVLVPLVELAPELVHPVLGRTVTDLLRGLDRTGITRIDSEP